jgi:hypothetical protein
MPENLAKRPLKGDLFAEKYPSRQVLNPHVSPGRLGNQLT